MKTKLAVGVFFAFSLSAWGQNILKGFIVPKESHSPDGRYGVTVPKLDLDAPDQDAKLPEPKNSLIDLKTGRLLTSIETQFIAYDRMNHDEILPARWSPDGSLLLWTVDGKFGVDTLVLLRLQDGASVGQTNVRKAVQDELLARTKEAAPRAYAAAKKRNAGSGVAFPEGFNIDADVSGPHRFSSPR